MEIDWIYIKQLVKASAPYLSILTVFIAAFLAIMGAWLNARQTRRNKWLDDFRITMKNHQAYRLELSMKLALASEDLSSLEYQTAGTKFIGNLYELLLLTTHLGSDEYEFMKSINKQNKIAIDAIKNKSAFQDDNIELNQIVHNLYRKIANQSYLNFWSSI